MRPSIFFVLASLSFQLLLTSGVSRADVTVIRAARVVDPEAGTTLRDQTILVEDSRIVAIGPDVRVPAEAKVLAISDLTLLPGYFDCHAHVAAWLIRPQRAIYTTWVHSTAYRVLRGSVYAREMLEAGFTTIRNLSEAGNYGDTALAQAIDEGVILGPKMIPAGLFVVPSGAEAPPNPEKPDLNSPDKVEADTLDELRKVIRRNIHFGARVIKVLVDDTPYIYSAEELAFMVAEAGAAGVKVAAHAVTDRGARAAAEARVASIEHGTDMSEETRALVRKNEVIVVPTPFTPFLIGQMGIRLSGMKNSDDFADADKVHERYVGALKRNYESGIKLAFGSDVGVLAEGQTRGTLALSTVEGYIAGGVPPLEILRALTVNAAELVGVEDQRGRIRPGFFADLVAVEGDPLTDARALTNVRFVMKEGKVVRWDRSPNDPSNE